MNRKDLIGCLDKIAPSASEKKEMLDTILESRKGEILPMKRTAKRLSLAAVAVIIICMITATTALAVALGWHEKLIEFFNPTEQQIEQLEPAVSRPEVSVTENGVTVTIKQTIADSMGVYVLYEIIAPEDFKFTDNIVFKSNIFSVTTDFAEDEIGVGVISKPIVLEDVDNRRTVLQHFSASSAITNGTAELILGNLGNNRGTLIEGRWELEWEFSYTDTSKAVEIIPHVRIAGGTKAVTKIVISPLSICVFVNGNENNMTLSVNFKDGSQKTYSIFSDSESGRDHITRDETNTGEIISQLYHSFNEIIDPENVKSIEIEGVMIPIS